MTKAPIRLQELRRRIYRKAKPESVGWRRWSSEYLYDVLGLYWDWKIQPLPGVGRGDVKVAVGQQDS